MAQLGGLWRDAAVLARTELRARLRMLRGNVRQLIATIVVLVLFGIGLPLLAAVPTIEYAATLASGDVPPGPSGLLVGGVAAVGLYFGAASGFNQNRIGDVGPLVRTSIPPRAVALGRMTSELVQGVAFGVPTMVVVLLIVAIGAGGPIVPILVVIAGLPVLLASLFVGRVLGDGLRYANRYLGVSLWTKALVFVLLTVGIYIASQALIRSRMGETDGLGSVSISALLPGTPLQAYATVTLDPLAAAGHPVGLLVAAAMLVTIPLALAALLRLETGLVLAESSSDVDTVERSRGVPRPFTATLSTRLAWRYLLRTRRDPRMLAHLSPLLFAAMPMLASFITEPRSLLLMGPAVVALCGTIVAGAAFCLNPLGDDRVQLPFLLTSASSTAVVLRGRALAGLIPGLAIAIGIGTPLAVYAYGIPMAIGQSLLVVALALAGTGTSLGVGALIPKYERREYMSVERAHPSMIAVMGVFFGGIVVGAIGLLLVYWTVSGARPPLALAAWTGYLLVLALFGFGGYRYAVGQFHDLHLDDT